MCSFLNFNFNFYFENIIHEYTALPHFHQSINILHSFMALLPVFPCSLRFLEPPPSLSYIHASVYMFICIHTNKDRYLMKLVWCFLFVHVWRQPVVSPASQKMSQKSREKDDSSQKTMSHGAR